MRPAWEAWHCPGCSNRVACRSACAKCGTSLERAEELWDEGVRLQLAPSTAIPVEPEYEPDPTAAPDASGGTPPSATQRPVVATSRPPRMKAALLIGGAAGLVVGLVALVASLGVPGVIRGHLGASHAAKIDYPGAWDPRVADLASFVEKERGLTFVHPVHVDFLTPAEYTEAMTTKDSSVTAADRKEMDQSVAMLRAMGLVSGKVDLLAASNKLQDDGTLAAYNFETKRIAVRGTEMTPSLRVTLVHELTHAAQDQHFDLTRSWKFDTDGANNAFHTIVEGDAVRIESRYIDQLSEADQKSYDDQSEKDQKNADLGSVPPALVAFFGAPYDLGEQLVNVLDQTGGNAAVDDAFRRPPMNEAQLLDPFQFLVHREWQTPSAPKLDKGDEKIDSTDFGALALYFVLAARLDPHAALKAADAWGGDAMVEYRHKGTVCVRASFVGDSDAATTELQQRLGDWTVATHNPTAVVGRVKDVVTMTSCDPGEGASAGAGPGLSADSLALPVVRTSLAVELLKNGADQPAARCIAGKVVDAHPMADFADPEGAAFQTPAFEAEVARDAGECR